MIMRSLSRVKRGRPAFGGRGAKSGLGKSPARAFPAHEEANGLEHRITFQKCPQLPVFRHIANRLRGAGGGVTVFWVAFWGWRCGAVWAAFLAAH